MAWSIKLLRLFVSELSITKYVVHQANLAHAILHEHLLRTFSPSSLNISSLKRVRTIAALCNIFYDNLAKRDTFPNTVIFKPPGLLELLIEAFGHKPCLIVFALQDFANGAASFTISVLACLLWSNLASCDINETYERRNDCTWIKHERPD